MTLRTTIVAIALGSVLFRALPTAAQLYPAAGPTLGEEGTWRGCDTTLTVDFTGQLTGLLTYTFSPRIAPGMNTVTGTVWSYFDGTFGQDLSNAGPFTHTFPAPGEHLVCLTANAIDRNTQRPCSTVTCRIEDILQDTTCSDLRVDFTILGISGRTITFADSSTFPQGIVRREWRFGNSLSTASGATASHTFTDNGPHRIRLTVTGPSPVGCTATLDQWLYLGPVPVPCERLLEPAFVMMQHEGLVGVLDTSVTSGMNSRTTWDFGDGSPRETARHAIHGYATGQYRLCGNVRSWGPLVADTCVRTLCKPVMVMTGVGLDDPEGRSTALLAFPVPFNDQLVLAGLGRGRAEVEVMDAGGRLVHRHAAYADGALPLDLGHLAPGHYTIRCMQEGRLRVARAVRE